MWAVAALAFAVGQPVEAKRFENAYVAFDLPDAWTCAREDDDWVCQPPPDARGKFSMIVILTAKLVGPDDSPQLYIEHLEEMGRQSGVNADERPRDRLIGQTRWLDATLRNSERPGYQTRYLARIEGRVAVMLTFSAHRTITGAAKPISDALARSVEVNSAYVRPEIQAR